MLTKVNDRCIIASSVALVTAETALDIGAALGVFPHLNTGIERGAFQNGKSYYTIVNTVVILSVCVCMHEIIIIES